MTTDPDQLRRELLALGAEGGITGGDELLREIAAQDRAERAVGEAQREVQEAIRDWSDENVIGRLSRLSEDPTVQAALGPIREALGLDGPIEARRVGDVIEVRWEPDTEAHRRLLATARGHGVLSAERLEAGIETLPSWVDPATGVRHYSVVLDATTAAWEGVDRPPGVPACADAIYDRLTRQLSWHWVEATFRVTDDGEAPARARELDAQYGPCWRCSGMGV